MYIWHTSMPQSSFLLTSTGVPIKPRCIRQRRTWDEDAKERQQEREIIKTNCCVTPVRSSQAKSAELYYEISRWNTYERWINFGASCWRSYERGWGIERKALVILRRRCRFMYRNYSLRYRLYSRSLREKFWISRGSKGWIIKRKTFLTVCTISSVKYKLSPRCNHKKYQSPRATNFSLPLSIKSIVNR